MKRKKAGGITLLEILISVSIIFAITLSAAPLFQELKSQGTLKREAKRIKSILEFLHQQSKIREEEVRFEFQNSYFVAHSLSKFFDEGKTCCSLSPNKGSIVFYPSGITTPKTLTLKIKDEQCTLTLSLRGRVKNVCR